MSLISVTTCNDLLFPMTSQIMKVEVNIFNCAMTSDQWNNRCGRRNTGRCIFLTLFTPHMKMHNIFMIIGHQDSDYIVTDICTDHILCNTTLMKICRCTLFLSVRDKEHRRASSPQTG